MPFFNAEQIETLGMLSRSEKNLQDLPEHMMLGFEVACKAYFDSPDSKPIEIAIFMSENTQNNGSIQTALSRVRAMWGCGNFIDDKFSPDRILNFGFRDHGMIGQKRFETEEEFASVMAAKDIYIFGSHPHQVLMKNK